MKFVIDHYEENAKELDAHRIYIRAEDDRAMFSITLGEDDRSIEIMAVDYCRVQGVHYSEFLSIEPRSTNSVIVRTKKF